jgi:hypothetical protein
MKLGGAAVVVGLLIVWSSPALAWDLYREDGSDPPMPEPAEDPAPFVAPPPGLYYVTDTYVADVVTSSGPLTTYSTTTVHASTGSYARVLETVGTGVPSEFDGRAFNGRDTLSDGRPVAGTYYENYVFTDRGFVPVSIVFFQDDAELARLQALEVPDPIVTGQLPSVPPVTARPLAPECCTGERPVAISEPAPVQTKTIQPGISLLPVSVPLPRLEVLRGRAVTLWPRAFVDDREIPVLSWIVVAGEYGDAPASAGSGSVPFRSSWHRLAPPGTAYEIVFRIEVDTPATGHRTVDTAIAVIVRSPALDY